MDQYTATEEAYKRGQEAGHAAGYAQGFAEGLASAGIAPIQWRDVDAVPLPECVDVLLCMDDGRKVFGWLDTLPGIDAVRVLWQGTEIELYFKRERIRYWCPVDDPVNGNGKEDGDGAEI